MVSLGGVSVILVWDMKWRLMQKRDTELWCVCLGVYFLARWLPCGGDGVNLGTFWKEVKEYEIMNVEQIQVRVRQWSLSFHLSLLLNADFLLYVSIPAWEYDITSMGIGYCVQKSFFGYTFCAEFFTMYFMFPLLFKQCSLTFVDLRLWLQTVILQGLEVIDICRLLAPSTVWIL